MRVGLIYTGALFRGPVAYPRLHRRTKPFSDFPNTSQLVRYNYSLIQTWFGTKTAVHIHTYEAAPELFLLIKLIVRKTLICLRNLSKPLKTRQTTLKIDFRVWESFVEQKLYNFQYLKSTDHYKQDRHTHYFPNEQKQTWRLSIRKEYIMLVNFI